MCPFLNFACVLQVPLVEGSRELRTLLLSTKSATNSATPEFVRKLFKDLAARAPVRASSKKTQSDAAGGAGANGTVSLRAGNPSARNSCLLLLRYCLADLGGSSGGLRRSPEPVGGGGGGSYRELAGLPLVPLADGSHGIFRNVTAVDASKLAELRVMGFSEGRSRQALVKHGGVEPALEWLFSGGGEERGGQGEVLPFVLCVPEEARLLEGAAGRLISEDAFSEAKDGGGSSTPSGSPAVGTGETRGQDDDGRVLRALRSPSLQALINVTSMRDELLPDLIGHTLPLEWRGSGGGLNSASKTAFAWTPQKAGHPDVDWFRQLWEYLALTRPSAVRLLAESYPVVPTGESTVCPLSLRSAVIDATRLSPEVRCVLVRAGCSTLLPGVFAGGIDAAPAGDQAKASGVSGAAGRPETIAASKKQAGGAASSARGQPPPPPPELFEYVRPGTRSGVLAALGTAGRSAGKKFRDLMSAASEKERDALREFLAREPASEMSKVEVEVCRTLPILPLHSDGLAAANRLANAAVSVATGKAKPSSKATTQAVRGTGITFAAADEPSLCILLESGNGFVGVRQDGAGGEPSPSSTEAPTPQQPKWLETHLLTPKFLRVKGGSRGRGGAAEVALAERLGVELIDRAAFFMDHVFPRIFDLPAGLRDVAMVEALLEAPRLSQQHPGYRKTLEGLAFVPTGKMVNLYLLLILWFFVISMYFSLLRTGR